jgi:putative membrane protein
MRFRRTPSFLKEAYSLEGSANPKVLRGVCASGLLAGLICLLDHIIHPSLGIEVAPYEVAGAALGLLLVLRTNAGYERWWEARKLWGGIVNQSRNLAIAALAYGPNDPRWRDGFVRCVAAFAHVARRSLRGETDFPEVAALLGEPEAARIAASRHVPTAVASEIAALLRIARDEMAMDPFGFLQAERERATLIDHIGGCERILKSPLPRAYSTQIRRFIVLFLGTLPFALLSKVGWLTPFVTILVAYPILALDKIGMELQNPFSAQSLNHLPLDEISQAIEEDLIAILGAQPGSSHGVAAGFRSSALDGAPSYNGGASGRHHASDPGRLG